ncbi:hypothetical protein WG66_016052 [Moniliophthora roreri]|nr:hypothetical protein WG66_016052 [Moniliophthora roreri]
MTNQQGAYVPIGNDEEALNHDNCWWEGGDFVPAKEDAPRHSHIKFACAFAPFVSTDSIFSRSNDADDTSNVNPPENWSDTELPMEPSNTFKETAVAPYGMSNHYPIVGLLNAMIVDSKSLGSIPTKAVYTPPVLDAMQMTERQEYEDHRTMSISPLFGPDSSQSTSRPPSDVIIVSTDKVVFYADEYTLFNASNNRFNDLFPLQTKDKRHRILFLQEINSSEMQVFLQSIYNVASTDVPDFAILTQGIAWLPKYGIEVKTLVQPHTSIFDCFLSHAPVYPLEVYTCAAKYDLHDLAVQVSPYLLRVEPSNVTEEMAERMGSRYLWKYVSLHSRRVEVLKRLLVKGPDLHDITKDCGFRKQRELRAKWNLGVAQLVFVLKADTTTTAIREQILETTEDISCEECLKARDTRLNAILQEWSMSSRTI